MTTATDRQALMERIVVARALTRTWRVAADGGRHRTVTAEEASEVTEVLQAAIEALSSSASSPRVFPVQDGPDIPWSTIAPFEKQARYQHGGQTLERLAERGGLGVTEVLAILEGEGKYDRYWTQPGRSARDKTANILRLQALVTDRVASSQTQEERPASEAERALRSIATMLGWENVPPQQVLEAEIRALKARAQSSPVPPLSPNRFDCPECGQGVKACEDGTCASCGGDVVIIADGKPLPVEGDA